MALVYLDSFEHRNPTRYTSTGGAWAFGTTAKTGSYSYNFAATGGQTTTLAFPYLPASTGYHVGFHFYAGATTNYPTISLLNDGVGNSLLDITFQTSGGKVQTLLNKGAGGSQLLAAGTTFNTGIWAHISLTASISSNGSGTLYINESEQGTFTGVDIRNGGSTNKAGGIKFTGTGTTNHYLDNLYVLDDSGGINATWPGEMSVQWSYVNGAGASTQWNVSPSGTNWAAVDEPGTGGTDYVYATTTGLSDMYTTSDLTGTYYDVAAVQICATALKSDTGAMSFAVLDGSGGATAESATFPLTQTLANYYLLMDKTAGGAMWAGSYANIHEIGVRTK